MRARERSTERRRHKRKNLYCLIRYSPRQAEGPLCNVFTSLRNISGGGILFKSKERLPIDTILEVTINLPPLNRTVSVSARVAGFEKDKKTNNYLIRVSFVDIKEEDRDAIIRLAELPEGKER